MTLRKSIVCLANARKHLGRCVAGIELIDGRSAGWIRPVSSRPGHEVSEGERRCEDGADPGLLDVISVSLTQPEPYGFQSENWTLDAEKSWIREGRVTWEQLADLEDEPVPLWPNQATSTRLGQNDRVRTHIADRFTYSLRLIQVDAVQLRVLAPRKVQAWFTYLGTLYGVSVTDPVMEREYLAKTDGFYELGPAYLTLSLGEPYEGYCYKLAAALITRARVEQGG